MKAYDTVRHRNLQDTTIAEFNKVSLKQGHKQYNQNIPIRISLPVFFNIPCFQDKALTHGRDKNNGRPVLKENTVLKKRVKDLTLLAEGMKRAKNVKEQSRFYFTLGTLYHNNEQYEKSIDYFQKFLKIVIVMGDLKSVELGLNSIGCEYMYMGQFEKARQFHIKQAQTSQNPDKFISYANIGFCDQMEQDYKAAYSKYQMLRGELDKMSIQAPELEEREKLFEKLISRTEKRILENEVFMTEKPDLSPGKSMKNSFLKEESSIMMKKSMGNRQEYESAKLTYAISAAEENIDQYLKSTFKN